MSPPPLPTFGEGSVGCAGQGIGHCHQPLFFPSLGTKALPTCTAAIHVLLLLHRQLASVRREAAAALQSVVDAGLGRWVKLLGCRADAHARLKQYELRQLLDLSEQVRLIWLLAVAVAAWLVRLLNDMVDWKIERLGYAEACSVLQPTCRGVQRQR
jgi:hypothetical protein